MDMGGSNAYKFYMQKIGSKPQLSAKGEVKVPVSLPFFSSPFYDFFLFFFFLKSTSNETFDETRYFFLFLELFFWPSRAERKRKLYWKQGSTIWAVAHHINNKHLKISTQMYFINTHIISQTSLNFKKRCLSPAKVVSG